MSIFPEKYRLLAWLSLFLIGGFVTVSSISYLSAVNSLRRTLADQTLPLTGDNIYSEIQKDIIRPVFVSSLMAHDTFLRDWMLSGEKDSNRIRRYLKEITDKYDTVVSFLVSDLSRNYYHQSGILKQVRESEPRDTWFFRVRQMRAPYETNVDPDLANNDTMTIFVNYRVLDYDGRFIGAAGVGITVNTLNQLINRYQDRFARHIYFVDAKGQVVLSGDSNNRPTGSLYQRPGIRAIAGPILSSGPAPKALSYQQGGDTVLVNARHIPELGWYLVVEQSENGELRRLRQVFWLNLAIFTLVSAVVLLLVWLTLQRYHARLQQLITIDELTGCLNRRTIELMLSQAISDHRRQGRPFSLLLCDIDYFKQINDHHGHASGDEVLRQMGRKLRHTVRDSDSVGRWGGEEFLLLLRDTSLSQATQVAEKLRRQIAAQPFGLPEPAQPITISIGVVEYLPDEPLASLFQRADTALYQAKRGGRNRVAQPELAPA